MMYNNKFVAAIRVNGEILREDKDVVYVPFGTEYQIRLKNLNTVRALVNIKIDGKEVVEGGLVVNPQQTIDLERWVKYNNLEAGNKFRFIERTAKIEKNRGIGEEDGLIQINFQFEKPSGQYLTLPRGLLDREVNPKYYPNPFIPKYPYVPPYGDFYTTNVFAQNALYDTNDVEVKTVATKSILRSSSFQANSIQACSNTTFNDVGITVEGSKSEQKFHTVDDFSLEPEKHVIVFKILGKSNNIEVKKPVSVKTKKKCKTCGTVNKVSAKFCSECSTSLEIL